jgi:hypothetical protein
MSNFLMQFQEAAFILSPTVLVGVGFTLVWLGLCLWLGGLRWMKLLSGLVGACIGYTGAMYVVGPQTIALIVSAVIVGMICLFLDKFTIVIVGALLAAVIANLMLAMPSLKDATTWDDISKPQYSETSPTIAESLTTLETYGRYLVQKSRLAIDGLGAVRYTAAAIAGLVVLAIGFVMPRGVCALSCAILGVAAIAVGLLLLLLYKGSKPMDYILNQQSMLWIIALIMIGFGTLADLALCPNRSKAKTSPEKKPAGDKK